MRNRQNGFNLVELMVALVATAVLMLAVLSVFTAHARTQTHQQQAVEAEENLRMGMALVSEALRGSGAGLPERNFDLWVPWVAGFDANPTIAGDGRAFTIAGCFAGTVGTLSAAANRWTTELSVDGTTGIDSARKRLVVIGGEVPAHVKAAGESSITIDTNPTLAGNQGLPRAFPAGTPLCRVDAVTFSVNGADTTLDRSPNHAVGDASPVAGGIVDLRVATAGGRYEVTLTARSRYAAGPDGGAVVKTLASAIAPRS